MAKPYILDISDTFHVTEKCIVLYPLYSMNLYHFQSQKYFIKRIIVQSQFGDRCSILTSRYVPQHTAWATVHVHVS